MITQNEDIMNSLDFNLLKQDLEQFEYWKYSERLFERLYEDIGIIINSNKDSAKYFKNGRRCDFKSPENGGNIFLIEGNKFFESIRGVYFSDSKNNPEANIQEGIFLYKVRNLLGREIFQKYERIKDKKVVGRYVHE
jgi:hypothetical protein